MGRFAEGTHPARVVTLVGGTGTGKSHLLEAAARRMVQSASVHLAYVPALLQAFQRAFGDREATERMTTNLLTVDVLLLDDLGAEQATPWSKPQLLWLMDQRMRDGKALVVATNLGEVEIATQVDMRLASRLWDEQSGDAKVVFLTCGDYRRGR